MTNRISIDADNDSPTKLVSSVREASASVDLGAAQGVFWTIGFSLLNKAVALVCQITIAWFLTPKEIGLVAIASSLVGMTSMFMGAQLQRVLIQRQANFHAEAGQAFWLSVFMNGAVAILILLASDHVASAYGEPELTKLLWIMAAAIPLMALPVSHGAKLFIGLRFRFINACSFGEGIIRNVGAVLLAAAGFGPASIVIPLSLSALFAAAVQRIGAGKILLGQPRVATWKHFLAPGVWLIGIAFFTSALGHGTTLVIAAQHSPEVTGLFFWGASMSSQAVFLLVTNLQSVFFPIFSKMEAEPRLQREFFDRAIRLSMLTICPLCVLQILLAEPLIAIVFHERWLPAAPVIQWLSVGMLAQPFSILGTALLMSRASYRKLTLFTALTASANLLAAWVGGQIGTQESIAFFVGIANLITSVAVGIAAYRVFGGTVVDLWRLCSRPLIVGILVAVVTCYFSILAGAQNPLEKIVTVSIVTGFASIAVAKWITPDLFKILLGFVMKKCAAATREPTGG